MANTYTGKAWVWNPDDFCDARKFFQTKHEELLKDYIDSKFSKNSGKMDVQATAIVKRMISSMSNVYKEDIKREFNGTVDPKVVNMVNSSLGYAEQYKNLGGTALLWLYNDEETIYKIEEQGSDVTSENKGVKKLKALDASSFTVELDGAVVKSVYIRHKEVYNENDVQAWMWLKYTNGTIYEATGVTFETVGTWKPVSIYSDLPFILVQNSSEGVAATVTPFVTVEKSFAGGLALNRLSMAIAILRLLVATGASADDVKYLSEIVGNLTGIAGLPNTIARIDSVDMGSTEDNATFLETNTKELKMLAVQYGADYTSIDVEEKIESGRAKEIKKEYMNAVRVDNVPFWETFEFQLWAWLWNQDPAMFKPLVAIDFGTLTISLTASERVTIEGEAHTNDYAKVLTGLMSTEDYVRKYYPDYSDAEVKVAAARVEKKLI